MIIYRKACGGCCLLCRPSGAIVRALVPGAVAAAWGVALETCSDAVGVNLERRFRHPYPYQIFTLVFGFLLVFRTNFAYQRYWNASTFITTMHSKWGDAVMSVLSFDPVREGDDQALAAQRELRLRFIHLFSLLSVRGTTPVQGPATPNHSFNVSLAEMLIRRAKLSR